MTLVTCTPHGTIHNRRVVKLKVADEIDHEKQYTLLGKDLSFETKGAIQMYLYTIDKNTSLSQSQKDQKIQELRSRIEDMDIQGNYETSLVEYIKSESLDIYGGGRNPNTL
jgi:hypothetical protein